MSSASGSPVLKPVYIVMGVAGSGKTTIGSLLAERLEMPFYDADDFHPPGNLEKLSAGIPLNEEDREPWLRDLSSHMAEWARGDGAVVACSALKHSYRNRFREATPSAFFIHLAGSPEIIAQRLHHRSGNGDHVISDYHEIMKDQFNKLETPTSAMMVNIDQSPKQIVDEIMTRLNQTT